TKKQKKIVRNWLLFYFLTTMQLNQKDNLSGYFNQKIFESLYKNESKPAEWLTHFNQCVGSNFSESEQTVMEFRLYQKIYQHVYFSKVVESLYQNPEKREVSGRVKSVTYKVQSWYENTPFKKQLIHHGITIDVIVDLVLEHTDFLKRSKKIYIGTKKGRHWDQYLAKQLLTTELAEQITVVENWGKTTDFVIVDQKIPVLPAYKTFIISKNPSLKELENIQKELQKLLA
ncbi:MAG: DNA-binding protein, partial [Carnobacterium sp.]